MGLEDDVKLVEGRCSKFFRMFFNFGSKLWKSFSGLSSKFCKSLVLLMRGNEFFRLFSSRLRRSLMFFIGVELKCILLSMVEGKEDEGNF